jgi:hypothetical protein
VNSRAKFKRELNKRVIYIERKRVQELDRVRESYIVEERERIEES